jgi:hypothetical protein
METIAGIALIALMAAIAIAVLCLAFALIEGTTWRAGMMDDSLWFFAAGFGFGTVVTVAVIVAWALHKMYGIMFMS